MARVAALNIQPTIQSIDISGFLSQKFESLPLNWLLSVTPQTRHQALQMAHNFNQNLPNNQSNGTYWGSVITVAPADENKPYQAWISQSLGEIMDSVAVDRNENIGCRFEEVFLNQLLAAYA